MNSKKDSVQYKSEAQLQMACIMWYKNEWYKLPKNLWGTFNEGRDVNTKRSMGLLAGVSDLLYMCPMYGLTAIEMKLDGTVHNTKHLIQQAEWIKDVPKHGGFCDSLEMFQRIIQGKSQGIKPQTVIDYCLHKSTKSIKWVHDEIVEFAKLQNNIDK